MDLFCEKGEGCGDLTKQLFKFCFNVPGTAGGDFLRQSGPDTGDGEECGARSRQTEGFSPQQGSTGSSSLTTVQRAAGGEKTLAGLPVQRRGMELTQSRCFYLYVLKLSD